MRVCGWPPLCFQNFIESKVMEVVQLFAWTGPPAFRCFQLLYQQHKCNHKIVEQEYTSHRVMFFKILMCMTAFAMFMVQQHKRDRDTAKAEHPENGGVMLFNGADILAIKLLVQIHSSWERLRAS